MQLGKGPGTKRQVVSPVVDGDYMLALSHKDLMLVEDIDARVGIETGTEVRADGVVVAEAKHGLSHRLVDRV